ncbi:MAG: hypothetical protein R3E79_45375 [Caldilineaceae bacterium]
MNPALRNDVLDGADGLQACPGGMDFTHPGLPSCAPDRDCAPAPSLVYLSDRCVPGRAYRLPCLVRRGSPRTDYLVNGPQECLSF